MPQRRSVHHSSALSEILWLFYVIDAGKTPTGADSPLAVDLNAVFTLQMVSLHDKLSLTKTCVKQIPPISTLLSIFMTCLEAVICWLRAAEARTPTGEPPQGLTDDKMEPERLKIKLAMTKDLWWSSRMCGHNMSVFRLFQSCYC